MSACSAAIVTALLVSACGGGGSAPQTSLPAPAPPAKVAAATATATIALTIPQRAVAAGIKTPTYVSASSQSVSISSYAVVSSVIAGSPSATSNQNLTSTSPGCTGSGPITCSISVPVPLGQVAFSITVYQGLNHTGSILSQLPQSAATEATIVEGSNNIVLPLVLGGVPKTVTITPGVSLVMGGNAQTFPVLVTALDAAGNTIIGPGDYANPITLGNSDGTGSTSLSTATVTSPSSVVTLTYNGGFFTTPASLTGAAIGATVTPGSLNLQHGVLNVACSGSCTGLANGPAPYTETITEGTAGNTTFTLSGSGTSCTFVPASSATAVNGTATVQVYPNPAGGACTLGVTDPYAQGATASLSYVAAANPNLETNCGYSPPPPTDPYGGILSWRFGCFTTGFVHYGAYRSTAFDSDQNPNGFAISIYADVTQLPVRTFTVANNRYIMSNTDNNPYINFNGQSGASQVPYSSFIP